MKRPWVPGRRKRCCSGIFGTEHPLPAHAPIEVFVRLRPGLIEIGHLIRDLPFGRLNERDLPVNLEERLEVFLRLWAGGVGDDPPKV